ncbi:hypothetical protein [Thermoleophilum album]|uniref:Uncharacterized protein n=1 Tax=Thermoleophilum album TaxID=29539 RepID=A0A1H6FTK2_THEAL|nr:hypothetical protein [Thermoleophilum album]SEH14147.1 hypothetical protein SAMN02745716_1530 [Thermoleophilum album]
MREKPKSRVRRLAEPKPLPGVRLGVDGRPRMVAGEAVQSVLEEWLVEDRWWTGKPLRRRYFELVLRDGRNLVCFEEHGRWFAQRA